jgi:hypothetical protein
LRKSINIDLVAPIVWGTRWGNSFSIVIHDPIRGLAHRILGSSWIQKSNHLRFAAAIRTARSISVCHALSTFDRLRASGAPIANDGISARVLLSKCKTRLLQECAWPRQCTKQKQMAFPRVHSKFEADYWNKGSASHSCVLDMLSAHEELRAPI